MVPEGTPLAGYPYDAINAYRSGYLFATARGEQMRTIGMIALLPSWAPKIEDWSLADMQALDRFTNPIRECKAATARGKVGVVEMPQVEGGLKRQTCYQIAKNAIEQVFCGNCAAGGSAVMTLITGQTDHAFDVVSKEATLKGTAKVARKGRRFAVEQNWGLDFTPQIEVKKVGGFDAVECSFLLPYQVVRAPKGTDVSEIYAAFEKRNGIQSKVLVLDANASPHPSAHFYNSNGRHGAAPLTGLVTLAFLRTQIDWIADAVKGGTIETPSSIEEVPDARGDGKGGTLIKMPNLDVELQALGYSLA